MTSRSTMTSVDLLPLSDDLPGFSVAEALPELDAGTLRVVSCVAAAALLSGQSFAIFLFVATCAWTLVSATFSVLFSAFFSAFFVEPEPPVVATMRGAYVAYPAALTKFLIAAEAFLARVFRAPFAADIDVELADVAVEPRLRSRRRRRHARRYRLFGAGARVRLARGCGVRGGDGGGGSMGEIRGARVRRRRHRRARVDASE